MKSETSPKTPRKSRKSVEAVPAVEAAPEVILETPAVEPLEAPKPKAKPRKAKAAKAEVVAEPAESELVAAESVVADPVVAEVAEAEPELPVKKAPVRRAITKFVKESAAVAPVAEEEKASEEPAPVKKAAAKKKPAVAEKELEAETGPAPKLERLQKILAKAGISSRRKAEELILGGLVQINGQIVTELGTKADPARDHVRVDGKLLQGAERIRYFVLNKPKGFVTTVSDPEGRPTVMQFFEREAERLYPVGRLDYLSEGLLLVTNDGELANKLTKASSGVEKTYLVKVAGQPSEDMLDVLRAGVVIEKGRPGTGSGRVRTAPAQIRQVREGDNPWYEVIIIEGRNRELRKMFEEIGHHVEKIRRVGYGPLVLDQEPGKLRELEPEEVEQLRLAADGKLKTRRRRGPAPAQLSREAGKTVRFKKADGRPGYEKPGFKNNGRAPEPAVTDYVLPPRKPREFDENEKPAFNPDYKPGFRTGGAPAAGRQGFSRPGFGAGGPGQRSGPGAGGPRSFGKPEGGRAGFGKGPGQDRPFRPAPPQADFTPDEPRKPIHIEPVADRRDDRPRAGGFSRPGGGGRQAPGGDRPFRPRTEGFAGGNKPFRAYPGGPATGDRPQRPFSNPSSGPASGSRPPFGTRSEGPSGRPPFTRPGMGGKPFRPRTDGPPSGDRPFRPKPAGDDDRGPARPFTPGRPTGRPAGEYKPFTQRPTRPSGPGGPAGGDRPFRPAGDRPSFGRPSGPRPGGARPGGPRPGGGGEFRPGPSNRPFRPAGPGRPDGPPRFAPRADAPPTRRPKAFDGEAPREFRPRPTGRFDAPRPSPGGSNSKPSGKLGPDGQPRIKERHRDSFVGKNKGRPKPKGKKGE